MIFVSFYRVVYKTNLCCVFAFVPRTSRLPDGAFEVETRRADFRSSAIRAHHTIALDVYNRTDSYSLLLEWLV